MPTNFDPDLKIFSSPEAAGEAAANYVADLSAEAIAARNRFTVAFSGGSLPKLLCPPLVAEPLRSQINWTGWHVFWADERHLPLTHADSNYRLVREELFEHVDIPPDQIYPIDDTLAPEATAIAYQAVLNRVFDRLPRFDLILLGMGEDGHTASLFPHHPLLNESKRWVAAVLDSPKPPPERITLTLPLLNNARHVAFVTAGASKADVLSQVLETETSSGSLPAQRVQPAAGDLVWFVDQAAAANLNKTG
jgi:6-phosphogluconolactonase